MDDQMPFLVLFAVPVIFVGVLVLISRVSGWYELCSVYPGQDQSTPSKKNMQCLRLRAGMSYNNCVTVGVSASGLRLSLMFPFSYAHPPIFIPWRDIRIERKSAFLGYLWLELTLERLPNLKIGIPYYLESFLQSEAGSAFPIISGVPASDSRFSADSALQYKKWMMIFVIAASLISLVIGATAVSRQMKIRQSEVPYQITYRPTLRAYQNKYLMKKDHKAFAYSSEGAYGYCDDRMDEESAEVCAMQTCMKYRKPNESPCRIISVDGRLVKGHPASRAGD